MDLLNAIGTFYMQHAVVTLFAAPATFCVLAYYLFRKRDEFSRHAIQNTAATIVVVGLNATAFWLFVDEINLYLQKAYAALSIPTLPADTWDGMPLFLICILGIIAKDFADYWNHRLMHTTWLWPTHAAHHSDTHVNAFTTFRVHFLESIVMGISYLLLLTWLQMPMAIPAVYLFSHMHNLYVHTNLPFQHGPFKLLVASPAFHRWHHADVDEVHGKNLANIIPAWDALFGTYYADGICTAPMGATKSGVEDKNPILIFTYPFRQWARLIRTRIIAPIRARQTPPATPLREADEAA